MLCLIGTMYKETQRSGPPANCGPPSSRRCQTREEGVASISRPAEWAGLARRGHILFATRAAGTQFSLTGFSRHLTGAATKP